MKVNLEVIAATTIKRQKPWPRICWVGVENQSLLLLDKNRVSVLYIPSGKTKPKIAHLSNIIVDNVCAAVTSSGGHLVGLQKGGEVFVWNKDKEEIKTICGFSSCLNVSALTRGHCQIFSNNDISKVVVSVHNEQFFLWQHSTANVYLEGKEHVLAGRWSQVIVPEAMEMPGLDSKEACLSAVFSSTSLVEDSFELSIVFNTSINMSVCSLLMHFMPIESPEDSYPSVSTRWKCLQYPVCNISQGCEAISISGAYVPRYSHDGSILAIAVNQKSPADTSILFMSPFTDTLVSSEMKGCGINNPSTKRGKQYWVCDMAWTSDNLFIACMLANGSAALLSRLGDPLIIATHGCCVDMGPSCFLPLHPLVTVQNAPVHRLQNGDGFEPSSTEDGREAFAQCFSVSVHPSLPVIVFSDGYMVTFVQLPEDMSAFVLMRNLVLESSRHLQTVAEAQNIAMTLVSAYNLPSTEQRVKASPQRPRCQSEKDLHYSFEELDGTLNTTVDSEASSVFAHKPVLGSRIGAGALQNLTSGRIVFGEPDLMRSLGDSAEVKGKNDDIMTAFLLARSCLLTMWKLAVSSTEAWTANMDEVVKKGTENFVRLFSAVLDSPHVSDALNQQKQKELSPAVQNASLFQVISLYRHLLEVAQFDAVQRHLVHPVLQLAHRTLNTLLDSQALGQADPRLKTLSGCFTLLKFTEHSLNCLYVGPSKSEGSGLKDTTQSVLTAESGSGEHVSQNESKHNADENGLKEKKESGLAFDRAQLVTKRLAGSWKMLYKAVLSHQQTAAHEEEYQQSRKLLFAIQQCLHALNATIPQAVTLPVSKGDRLSLDGKHTLAVNAWKEQLRQFQESGNEKHAIRLLHSLLYTHLYKLDLLAAVEMVDNLVMQANVLAALQSHSLTETSPIQPSFMAFVTATLKSQAFQEPDMVPCIHDRAIRQVVQTLGRFMAAYFSNQPVYIFPPHNPQPLPALHYQANGLNNHILPKFHKEINAMVRQQKMSSIWTAERTMEYLLLSGLICEAVWFADQMGNWKTAFQLASAWSLHLCVAPQVYAKPRKPLMLPDTLAPKEILLSKLEALISISSGSMDVLVSDRTDIAQLTATLEDVMIAGVVSQAEVAPHFLSVLISHLKTVVQQFHPLVPAEFYLPAPPVFCPQPASSHELAKLAAVQQEISLRQQGSSLVQLILAVMNAAHVCIPALHWYIHQLAIIQPKAVQFKSNTEEPCRNFPDTFLRHLAGDSDFEKVKPNRSIYTVLCSFRDLCSLLWMLHARDTLSQNLRKREKFLSQQGYNNTEKRAWERGKQTEWLSLCWHCLQWAAHMLPFTRFLADESSIHKILLSMLLELVPSTDVADLMAEFFHDMTDIHPDLQERLDKIVFEWQSIIVKPEDDGRSVRNSHDSNFEGKKSVTFHNASPRGESLSFYFHKQQQVARKVLKKKSKCFGAYEEYIFAKGVEPLKKLHIGSRPAETKLSYFDFLDTFCAVSFSKVLDNLQNKISSLPLLNCLCSDLVNQEIAYFVKNVAAQGHKKQSLIIFHGSASSPEYLVPQDGSAGDGHTSQALGPTGLFRGSKIFDTSPERLHTQVTGYEKQQQHSNSTYLGRRRSRQPHRSPRQQQILAAANQQWSLTVNFGKRYTGLQQLVEWLEVWSNKQHNFGLGHLESKLELKPSMRLQIPAQLIVLSLWLLENKYTDMPSPKTEGGKRQGQHSGRGGHPHDRPASHSPHDLTADAGRQASPVGPRATSVLVSGPAPEARDAPQPENAGLPGLQQSLPLSSLRDEQDIRSAYEQVLDGQEETSSLLVSSLASDELPRDLQEMLQGSLSPSRQENAELNHTVFMERNVSPPERPRNPTPGLSPTTSLHSQTSTSPVHRSANTSPVHAHRSTLLHQYGGPTAATDNVTSSVAGEGGLAQLLQQVIRKEMRRMVQIQQHSLAAMMGAIDGDTEAVFSQQNAVNYNQSSLARRSNLPRSPQRSANMRRALSELHNLQEQTSPEPRDYSRGGEGDIITPVTAGSLHMSALTRDREERENILPRAEGSTHNFLRVPAEREEDGFRLPPVPVPLQAWGLQNHSIPPSDAAGPFPLLRLAPGPPQPTIFIPPPPAPAMPFMAPPPSYEQASQLQPLRFNHIPPPPDRPRPDLMKSGDGLIGIPLLHLPSSGMSQTSQGPLFGRWVPPEFLVAQPEEQNRQEAPKHKHLSDFQQQIAALQAQAELARRQLQEDKDKSEKTEDAERLKSVPAPVKRAAVRIPKAAKSTPTPQESTASTEEEGAKDSVITSDGRSEHDEEEYSQIHDGYAIPPGAFEGYENMEGQLGVEADTNTRFQYKMAQAMRRQLEAEKERWIRQRMVDFSINLPTKADAGIDVQRSFESLHRADAATFITKDTGVDPVQEAFEEYRRNQQGMAVPPDIYMGLRFTGSDHEASSMMNQAAKGRGRAFLNVVDVHASSVLRDIPEQRQDRHTGHIHLDTREQDMGLAEASFRAHLKPEVHRQHDAVTVRMFEQHTATEDRFSVALLPRSSVRESKTALIQQLRAMNDQIAAVEEMSENIEKDFQNSKMILETLQTMNEPYQLSDVSHARKHPASRDQAGEMEESFSAETPTPKMSDGSPIASARMSGRSHTSAHSKKSDVSRSGEMAHLSNASGMTDISDIIGEVLARGGVDLEAAGLTSEEAEMLAARAHKKHRARSPKTGLQELKTLVKAKDAKDSGRLPEWRREEIHQWMANKYTERQNEYMKRRATLKEHEVNPYKSPEKTQMGSRSLRTLEQERQQRRIMQEKQNALRRILDAEYLIGSAIADAAVVMSELPRSRSPSPRAQSRSRSASPTSSRSLALTKLSSRSPARSQQEAAAATRPASDRRGRSMAKTSLAQTYRVSSPPKSILKTAQSGLQVKATASDEQQLKAKPSSEETGSDKDTDVRGVYSRGDLRSYMQAIEELETSMEVPQGKKDTKTEVDPGAEMPAKIYKPKPFYELVRMQRPEVTRPKEPSLPPPDKYINQVLAEQAAQRTQSARTARAEAGPKTADSLKKAHGRMSKSTTPRIVKTYAQRLQEMKPRQRYATPIIPRQHVPESVAAHSARTSGHIQRRPAGPPHKPVTYVEQLKKINAAAAVVKRPANKPGTAGFARTHMPSRTATHKPKTYTQQLKELNAPFKRTFRSKARPPSTLSSARPRPYGDPYRVDSEDALSVLSDWSVDENIRRLIYDDSQSSVGYSADGTDHASVSAYNGMVAPSEAGASDYYDVIMGENGPEVPFDYRDSVDISELERVAEVMSVGSGSVLSVIDWDAVDKLIEDV